MWMYYETDGDSGASSIKLFSTEEKAREYRIWKGNSGYAQIEEYQVDEPYGTKTTIKEVLCPTCGGPMISRTGKYGTFWGCKKYPNCTGTRDSMGRSKEEREAERSQDSWRSSDSEGNPRRSQSGNTTFKRGVNNSET